MKNILTQAPLVAGAKKAVLTAALAATAITGTLASATPAMADGWHGEHHGGGGFAVAAGILGLLGIAAIASAADHPQPVAVAPVYPGYGPAPVYPGYAGPAGCFEAYPGYSGYCYPANYYYNLGWAFRDGYWFDHDGQRYAHPFYNRGAYANYGAWARAHGGGQGGRAGYNGSGGDWHGYNGGGGDHEHR